LFHQKKKFNKNHIGKESTDILALIDEKIKDAEKHQERIGNLEKNIEEQEG
jgi:hypothetical protein